MSSRYHGRDHNRDCDLMRRWPLRRRLSLDGTSLILPQFSGAGLLRKGRRRRRPARSERCLRDGAVVGDPVQQPAAAGLTCTPAAAARLR